MADRQDGGLEAESGDARSAGLVDTAALERTRRLLRMVARNPKDVRQSDVPYVLAVVANGVREALEAVLRVEQAGGTTGDAERRPPESASGSDAGAGRMADRPGDPEMIREIREHQVAGGMHALYEDDLLDAWDEAVRRLSEAEQALRFETALTQEADGRADAAEVRLSVYEQALPRVIALAQGLVDGSRERLEEDGCTAEQWDALAEADAELARARAALTTEAGNRLTPDSGSGSGLGHPADRQQAEAGDAGGVGVEDSGLSGGSE